jgi:hypothetical protein
MLSRFKTLSLSSTSMSSSGLESTSSSSPSRGTLFSLTIVDRNSVVSDITRQQHQAPIFLELDLGGESTGKAKKSMANAVVSVQKD